MPGAPAGAPPPQVKVDAPGETAAVPKGPTKVKKTKQQRKEALFKKKRARAVLSHKVQSLDMGLYPVDTDSRYRGGGGAEGKMSGGKLSGGEGPGAQAPELPLPIDFGSVKVLIQACGPKAYSF